MNQSKETAASMVAYMLQKNLACECWEAIGVISLIRQGMLHSCERCENLTNCGHEECLAYATLGHELAHLRCQEAIGRVMANVMHEANPMFKKWDEMSEPGQDRLREISQKLLDEPYFAEYYQTKAANP